MTLNPSWQPSLEPRTELVDEVKVIRIPALNPVPRRFHHDKVFFMIDYIPVKYRTLVKAYDIIHFHNDGSLCFPFFSYSVDRPKIFHCHCLNVTYPLYERNFISRYVLKKSADLYIVVSRWMVNQLTNLGVTSDRIRVVYNGIDVNRFHPGELEKSENTLLFVGRLSPVKGLLILLESLLYLKRPISLKIVGPTYDNEYAKNIADLAKKVVFRTKHDITFMGLQPEEELIRLYQKASLVVMPSLSEPFGLVGLESLSCETPVIASSVGGIPEVIENGKNGILVRPNDHKELARAIESLLEDRELRLKFGSEGRRMVEERFSARRMIEALIALYEELGKR